MAARDLLGNHTTQYSQAGALLTAGGENISFPSGQFCLLERAGAGPALLVCWAEAGQDSVFNKHQVETNPMPDQY